MSEPAKKRATYEDLYSIPENMTGEIIDGELFAHPRPNPRHSKAASFLGGDLIPSYSHGRGGGPGGWIFLDEVEIKLGEECNPIVPDISGWKVERFPGAIETNWISVPPDWVCEIISPSTAGYDRVKKMAKYAKFGVGYAWLIDPVVKTLEAYKLESGHWLLLDAYVGAEKVRMEPFQEIEIDLEVLWLEP